MRSPGRSRTRTGADAIKHAARFRLAIEGIMPDIDGGRFVAKAQCGEPFPIEADVFCDGHDVIRAAVLWWASEDRALHEQQMAALGNDRWRATITFPDNASYAFTIIGWRDLFASWHMDTGKKIAAGQTVSLEAREGVDLLRAALAARPAPAPQDRIALRDLLGKIETTDSAGTLDLLMAGETLDLMHRAGPRTHLTRYERDIPVFVDRPRAGFSAWYELFPRSTGAGTEHGTFRTVIDRLPYVRDLGFDVLYFPPIHPIGRTNRKGRNNSLTPAPDDPGSPYAIGSTDGGHDAVHPDLGTLEDFDALVAAAHDHGLEIALDFAIQCSPDHPWIIEHPEWFDWRPDGTIKFAENPPKKYEDIVNVHFYRDAIPGLWLALREVVLFWIGHGVRIFRVDNPHTKPFPFWEWLIAEIRRTDPGVIFLAEAFTRPKVMKRLAKLGFNQSYSYFTWRDTKAGLTEYLTELTAGDARHYMRPNFFVNTPDINPYFLQSSGRPGFRIRLVLAATLGGNYGIYNGFEICEAAPVPGKEEYLDSEKYEIRDWDFDRAGHIKDDIRLINRLRADHPALQRFAALKFFNAFDDAILYYGKFDPGTGSYLLFHVLLDPHGPHDFAFEVPLWEFGLPDDAGIAVEDLLNGNRFVWQGKTHQLTLDPDDRPYAIWRLHPAGDQP